MKNLLKDVTKLSNTKQDEQLLTRSEFRQAVFTRDNHTCVFCSNPAVDAHHILERRLWGASQGYLLSNGASVCAEHHMACERTDLSVEQVREACGIIKFTLPDHLYEDQVYDKWGNIVLPTGQRLKGELFFDESVQKILMPLITQGIFSDKVKYPRTYHLPWSPGMHDDDRMMQSLDGFMGEKIIVTEKLDGENTTLGSRYTHARSVDSRNHESRNWVKNFWSQIAYDIPQGWNIRGENVFAEHSIPYNELDSFFYGFSIWNERNEILSWDDTLEWFDLLGILHVPVIYEGIFDPDAIKEVSSKHIGDCTAKEGYVVRVRRKFNLHEFPKVVGKYVRKGHIMTTKHWMHGRRVVPNKLKVN